MQVLVALRCVTVAVLIGVGATFISAPAHASGEVDQSATFAGTGSSDDIFSGFVAQRLSQSFTAGVTGTLTSVDVGVSQSLSPTNLTIAIFDAVSGLPVGTSRVSRTLAGADLSAVTSGQALVPVSFSSPMSVTAGATYAIVTSTTASSPAKFEWYRSVPYARGTAAYDDGSGPGWNSLPYDFTFATYVISDPAPQSGAPDLPAAITQQFGKTDAGSCDVAAPESLNWAGVAGGGWSESWAEWMNDGTGGVVCTRTLIFSVAQGGWTIDQD